MVSSASITENLQSLGQLQQRCGLRQSDNPDFFPEWTQALPELYPAQQTGIEQIKQRYDYHRVDGLLLEGTINLIVVSPLLELAGFLDPPFRIRAPYGVALDLQDPEETVRGFIDTLVVQELLWILVVESKKTSISVPAALPQLLGYMLASPTPEHPVFGMATNGDEFIFLKVLGGATPQFDVSRTFSLVPRRHELATVLQILQQFGQIVLEQLSN